MKNLVKTIMVTLVLGKTGLNQIENIEDMGVVLK